MSDRAYVPDWSALPTDLLGCISGCFPMIEDFMAFRGVCTSWRSATAENPFVSVSKVPLLMLAEKDDDNSNEREFYSLSKRKICMVLPVPGAKGKRCIDVGFGWILTLAPTGEVTLLKPFSSVRIDLLNFMTFPNYDTNYTYPAFAFIQRGWITANPSETSDFTLVVQLPMDSGFWRNGDKKWALIKNARGCLAMACYKEKVYCLDYAGCLSIWDLRETDLRNPQGLVVKQAKAPSYSTPSRHDYLLMSTTGELLMIYRNNCSGYDYDKVGANCFRVMRVDLVKGECIEIDGLGKDAVFLGQNAAVAVDATGFPGVLKPDCIYFTDDCIGAYYYHSVRGGGKDMG